MAMREPRGDLNPDYVATVEFNLSRRGYEPAEVRALLREVAENLAALHRRDAELAERLAQAEAIAVPSLTADDVDEAELTAILGEKTTQVLDSAREAASDIHRRSVEKARDLVDQATSDTQRMRAEAESVTRTAKERADELERKAEQRAKQLSRTASSEADRMRADAEQVVRAARQQADQLVQDAEGRASATTTEADEQAARSRAKGETLLAKARADAEQLESETQARVARMLRETEEAIAAQQLAADAEIARTLAAAEVEAERLRLDAEHRARHAEEAGRDRGRDLVDEAMAAREQVLRDLAAQRRRAHVQLAQLRLGRERLLEAYAVVRETAEQATTDLDGALERARVAAESEADRLVGDETKLTLEQLEAAFGVDRLREVAVLGHDAEGPAESGTPDATADDEPSTIDLGEASSGATAPAEPREQPVASSSAADAPLEASSRSSV